MESIVRNKLLLALFVMAILFALHYGIPIYSSSSYLNQYFGTGMVSAIYMIASGLILISSVHLTKYLKRYHSYGFTFWLVVINILSVIMFSLSNNPFIIVPFFITHFTTSALLFIMILMFVEELSPHANNGAVRGMFLTVVNMTIIIAPFIGGFLLARGGFTAIYLTAAAALIPFLYLLHKYFKYLPEPKYQNISTLRAGVRALRNKDLRGALLSVLLLQCFYAVIIIYLPLYLTKIIHIDLAIYMSVIVPVSLLPFVIFPYELGVLADTKIGEKELMIAGLAIMSITTLAIVMINTTNIIIWAILLFIARVGATFVETMTFIYFFKKIKPEDSSMVALFSDMPNMAIIFVGLFGIIVTPLLVNYPGIIFIMMGLALLVGIIYVLPIKDTKK